LRFPGVRALFEYLKATGIRVALGTDCQKDELDHYLDRAGIRDLIDAAACGSDVKHGKPHPDVFELARKRLKLRTRGSIVCVGDTPYDAAAARSRHGGGRRFDRPLRGARPARKRLPHDVPRSTCAAGELQVARGKPWRIGAGILTRVPASLTTGEHGEPHQSEHASLRPRGRNDGEGRTRHSAAG
jgi:haloacid dehalogenase-like hydrolase